MAITTYSELQTAVATWTHRTDLTAQIVDFITLAEFRLARDLRISQLTTTGVTATLSSLSAALPTGWLEMIEVKATATGAELKYIPPDTYARAVSNVNAQTTPNQYTIVGSNILAAPAWSSPGTLTLTYFKKETVLSGSNTSNQYLTICPDLLLYAALLEAAPYIKAEVDTTIWKNYYEAGRDALNRQFGVLDAYGRMLNISAGKGNALTPNI